MSFFQKIADSFTSTRRPKKGTKVAPKEEVIQQILAINRDTCPYNIYRSEEAEVDLIAEWKIVDAEWHSIFNKSGLKEVFKIYMRFDDATKELRAVDKSYQVNWSAGIPSLSIKMESFRGQKQEVSFGKGYAFNEKLEFGEVFNYRFSTKEMKEPIQKATTESGWLYRGVAFKKS